MVRPYRPKDAPGVVDLWNRTVRAEAGGNDWYVEENALSEARLKRIAANPNFDPEGTFVHEEQGRIAGYARAVVKTTPSYEGEPLAERPGYLEGLVVDRALRRRGLGSELLERAESYVRSKGKGTVKVSRYSPAIAGLSMLPDCPGLRFLVKRGYKAEPFQMQLELRFADFRLRDEVVQARDRLRREGVHVRYYEERDRDSFVALQESHFPHWWHSIYRPNLERDDPLPVLVAVDGDRVVGFIGLVHVSSEGRAGFTPGTDPDYRRRGIGTVLVNLWAAEVKERGAVESRIATGTTNYPAQHIYFGMGYRKLGEFTSNLTKQLS